MSGLRKLSSVWSLSMMLCVFFVVDTFHYAEKVYILGVVTSFPTAFIEGTVKEAWVTEKLQPSTVPFHGAYCAVRG